MKMVLLTGAIPVSAAFIVVLIGLMLPKQHVALGP